MLLLQHIPTPPHTHTYTHTHTHTHIHTQALAPDNDPLTLFVHATDGINHGIPNPRLEVRIILDDVNDNNPVFSNLPNAVTFPEVRSMTSHTLQSVLCRRADLDFEHVVVHVGGSARRR